MTVEVCFTRCLERAKVTGVCFLVSVSPNVSPEDVLMRGTVRAVRTGEWLFSRVCVNVLTQELLSGRTVRTIGT